MDRSRGRAKSRQVFAMRCGYVRVDFITKGTGMRRIHRIAAVMLAFAVHATDARAASLPGGCRQPATAATLESELLDWINVQRKAHGARPYARSAKLDKAADAHACDMALRDFFAHTRPGGPALGKRIKATGYRLKAGNENIAYTRQHAVSSAAEIWRNSPPHWAAIIDPSLRDIGISVTIGNGGKVYWVMDVARTKQ
jgi:uncharacterized protein YkwD